jgi:hypothetical protein
MLVNSLITLSFFWKFVITIFVNYIVIYLIFSENLLTFLLITLLLTFCYLIYKDGQKFF